MNKKSYDININISEPRMSKLKSIKMVETSNVKTSDIDKKSLNRFCLLPEDTLPLSKLKKTHLLLPFKLYSKVQNTRRFKQRIEMGIFDRHNVIVNDLRNRMYTKDPKNDIFAITDIDTEYFTCINRRPLNLHAYSYKSYKAMLSELLKIRHAIGNTKDYILNDQVNYKNELKSYDLSIKRFTDQIACLDIFINEDYRKSMELLSQWEKLQLAVSLKVQQLQNLGIEKFTIISRLISLDYIFSIQQKYGRFLYYLSPPSWRVTNRDFAKSIEIEQKGFDLGKSNDDDTVDELFRKLYGNCYGTTVKPVLYFSKPNDLIKIFDSMEKQQRYYFTHVNHLAPFINNIKSKIQSLKDEAISDTSLIKKVIKSLKKLLELSEERCTYLTKKFFQILHGLFYDSTAATDVLRLNFNLQFCFEKVFGEKATHMDIVAVAKSLENFYMDYSKALDMIESNTIRRCIEKYSEKQLIKFRKAKIAAKELRLFDRLEQELLRTYNFPVNTAYVKKSAQNKKRSIKTQHYKHVPKENKKVTLTEAEIEYLTLFTEWRHNEDPAQYLHGLNMNGNKE